MPALGLFRGWFLPVPSTGAKVRGLTQGFWLGFGQSCCWSPAGGDTLHSIRKEVTNKCVCVSVRVSVPGQDLELFLEQGESGGLLDHLYPCTSALGALQKHIQGCSCCSVELQPGLELESCSPWRPG